MDLSSYTQSILQILPLLILYIAWKIIANKPHKNNGKKVPEPSGSWPLVGHLPVLGGNIPVCRILGSIADKYGPIYSLNVGTYRTLIVSSWEIAKECLTINDRVLATRPPIAVGKYIGYEHASFALSPYGQYWRSIRRIAITELLSPHRVEMSKEVRSSAISAFMKELRLLGEQENGNKKSINMSQLMENLMFNMNLTLIAGKKFSAKEYEDVNSEGCRLKKAIKEAVYLSGAFFIGDAIPWLDWMDFKGVGRMKRTAKEIDSVIGKWLHEHLERNSNTSDDFMDALISKLKDEDASVNGYTHETIVKATAMILIFTGAESTLVALTWIFSLLLNHPKALKAAQAELDNQVGKIRLVTESDLKNLKYLEAIVKESLRLKPPGPVTGPREATQDIQISDYNIPKGTRLIINIWKLHRDPRVFENPDEFKPERFLTSRSGVDYVNGLQFGYIPFSYGRRSCPGMSMGLQVVHIMVARVLQGFDLSTVDGLDVDLEEGLGIDLPKLMPLYLSVRPRLESHLY